MATFCRLRFHRDPWARSGLSRLETVFLVIVVAVLVAVAYGPVFDYLTNGKMTRGVNGARTISTLLSQYATDNNGVYPTGDGTSGSGKSEGIALNLLQNNYTPDTSVFSVGTTTKYRGSAADFSDLKPENISWDFTTGATATTGITSTAPDLLPVVYTTGEQVTYPTTPGSGFNLPVSGHGPFGVEGVVVAYKANNAVFLQPVNGVASGFISTGYKDIGVYTQIKP
jgi:hypothetical protein